MGEIVDIILKCAEIPSFSTYEHRIHPIVQHAVEDVEELAVHAPAGNNLVLTVPGHRPAPPVALTAHLDKINHLGRKSRSPLMARRVNGKCIGQLDDSVGLGICLHLAALSATHSFPPLYILLSEMEEGFGFRNHPHLLKDGGTGFKPKLGAERISAFLLAQRMVPALVITVDTTPCFKGTQGVALYFKHWEFNGLEPSRGLVSATCRACKHLKQLAPGMTESNNPNDYIKYGELFNRPNGHGSPPPVPSLAIEPAIYPYHQPNEEVFVSDIQRVVETLTVFLETFDFGSLDVS